MSGTTTSSSGAELLVLDDVQEWMAPGQYLGHRLLELGCDTVFVVPGDFNLPVLDALASVPGLRLVNLSSELACAYAADGYTRAKPGAFGCLVTTFLVGALSALNGVAGSYAEELPVLSIVGVPATRQYSGMCNLHHTVGNAEDMSQEVQCYRPVTCYQTILRSMTDARYLIDKSLTKLLTHRKPVLLEICRDIPLTPHSSFGRLPSSGSGAIVPRLALPPPASDAAALEGAVAAMGAFFRDKRLPLIVAGRRIRTCQAAVAKLADALGWGVVLLADGKGMFPETHPAFLGTFCPFYPHDGRLGELLGAADGILFIGTHFNEMNFPAPDEALEGRSTLVYKNRVVVGHTAAFNAVATEALLAALAGPASPLPRSDAAVRLFAALPAVAPPLPADPAFTAPPEAPLKMAFVQDQLQALLDASGSSSLPDWNVVVDTGDSMFRMQTLKLPAGTPFEIQLFAANIGFACPAGLGFALARPERRTLVIGGDGGLQMTSGAIGDYVRARSNAVWVVINNSGYLIEKYISPVSDAPYNSIASWDYALLAEAMCCNQGKEGGEYRVFKVRTKDEAASAFAAVNSLALRDAFVFIEVIVDKRDAMPAASAVRTGYLAKHFASIPGYAALNLPGSSADGHAQQAQHPGASDGGQALSSLTGHALTGGGGAEDAASNGGAAAAAARFCLEPTRFGLHAAAGSSSCLVAGASPAPAPPTTCALPPSRKRPAEAALSPDDDGDDNSM